MPFQRVPPWSSLTKKFWASRAPGPGWASLKIWAQLYVVNLGVGPASPLGPRGPKLGGTFKGTQDPSRYNPKTFGFGQPTGGGGPKKIFLGHFEGPFEQGCPIGIFFKFWLEVTFSKYFKGKKYG